MQPIQSAASYSAGEKPPPSRSAEQPLSPTQRTVLERLVTRIVALNQQQPAEIWAGLKHDLTLKHDVPLGAQHFSAAENNLNQRLEAAQSAVATRQVMQQLTTLLSRGNHRQAVSDFIRQQFGQTALSQLTAGQLKTVLTLLQNNQLSTPQPRAPEQPSLSDRPMQPAEQTILKQLVNKLSAATGESGLAIWQKLLASVQLKPGDFVPARLFAPLSTWLQASHTLSQHPAPALLTVQAALKQPLTEPEWQRMADYSQQHFQATPQTVLTPRQVQDVLTQILLYRTEHISGSTEVRDIKPIASPAQPLADGTRPALSPRYLAALVIGLITLLVVWMGI